MADNSRHIAYFWPVWIVAVIFGVCVTQSYEPYGISVAVLSLLLVVSKPKVSFTALDIVVVAWWLFEGLSLLTSINNISVFAAFQKTTLVAVYYFVIRGLFAKQARSEFLLYLYSWILFFAAVIAMVSFNIFSQKISTAGFDNMYDFRNLYQPWGFSCNAWGTFSLGFLCLTAFACYCNRRHKTRMAIMIPMFIPVLLGVVRSLSRGIYISFPFLLLVFVVSIAASKALSLRRKAIVLAVAALTLTCVILPYKKDVLRTMRMTETLSQQRSLDSRLNAISIAGEIFGQYPVFGVGNGNYPLAANNIAYEDDNVSYSKFAAGLIAQLPSEKGIVGILILLGFSGAVVWMLFKDKKRDLGTVIVMSSVIALLMRELAFPTLSDYYGAQMILATLLAVYQNKIAALNKSIPTRNVRAKVLKWIPFVIVSVMFPFVAIYISDAKKNQEAVRLAIKGELESAGAVLSSSVIKTTPYFVNMAVINWHLFKATDNISYLDKAKGYLKKAIAKNPLDMQLVCFMAVFTDAGGDRPYAVEMLQELIEKYPENSVYRFVMFRTLYGKDKHFDDENTRHLVKAVRLAPRLMDTPLMHEIEKNERVFSLVKSKLLCDTANMRNDPVEYARKGKILLALGDTIASERYLNRALDMLPNISLPWCYLGVIACERGDTVAGRQYLTKSYTLNQYEPITLISMNKYLDENIDMSHYIISDPYSFMYGRYTTKFSDWYLSRQVPFTY